MQDLYHFYHIYADGQWEPILKEHLEALSASSLIENIKMFFIGIAGNEQNREKVKIFLNNTNYKYSICSEANDGWEQVTLNAIYDFAQKNDGCVLYAHTKGASRSPYTEVNGWRQSMTQSTVLSWKDCVQKIEEGAAAAGAHYFARERYLSLAEVYEYGFFAGNFWWTSLSNIKQLQPCQTDNRWHAESWISDIKQIYENQNKQYYIYDNNHVGL